jgi:hypothetical protein
MDTGTDTGTETNRIGGITDKTGRFWPVEIHIGTLERAQAEGYEIRCLSEDGLKNLEGNISALVQELYFLCDARSAGLTLDDFRRRIQAKTIKEIVPAILGAVLDFSGQSPEAVATAVLEIRREIERLTAARQELAKATIQNLIGETSSITPTDSPVISASGWVPTSVD